MVCEGDDTFLDENGDCRDGNCGSNSESEISESFCSNPSTVRRYHRALSIVSSPALRPASLAHTLRGEIAFNLGVSEMRAGALLSE